MKPRVVSRRLIVVAVVAGLGLATTAVFFAGSGGPTPRETGDLAESAEDGSDGAGSTAPSASTFEQDGFRVEMTLQPLRNVPRPGPLAEWEHAELAFTVREAAGRNAPLSGLRPLSWLVRRGEDEPFPDRQGCKREINSLLAGRLAKTADVNLNEYLLLTLDDHNSVSIVDPQIESSKTKTVGMISLPSRGSDFVLAPDRRTVLITLPEVDKIAAGDLNKARARYVKVADEPYNIEIQPDGHYAWIGSRSGADIVALGVEAFEVAARLTVGPGPHRFAFRSDNRYLFTIGPNDPFLSIIDIHSLEVVKQIEVGDGQAGVVTSAHSGAVYVGHPAGLITVVDAERHVPIRDLRISGGLTSLHMSPDGRFGFALNRENDQMTIFETATDRPAYTIEMEREPDAVDFTDTFAYIRHAGSELMVLIDLTSLGEGREPITSTVVLGRQPPTGGRYATIAPTLAPLPEGGGALVLNGPDRSIYHFMEGMNAPMGAYQTYPWTARGVLIADRTLQETDKGRYTTDLHAPRAGRYTVPFLVASSPQLYGCFDLTIAEMPGKSVGPRPLHLEPLYTEQTFEARKPSRIVVRLTDSKSGEPVSDLRDVLFLAYDGPRWHLQSPGKPIGDGQYEITATFPTAGKYRVMVGCPSQEVKMGSLPSAFAEVVEPATAGALPSVSGEPPVEGGH